MDLERIPFNQLKDNLRNFLFFLFHLYFLHNSATYPANYKMHCHKMNIQLEALNETK